MQICWQLDDAADAIAAMPIASVLPLRTILVEKPDIATHLRRILIDSGRVHLLAGTRFLTPAVLAEATLRRAGVLFQPGEDELREHRIAKLVADGLDPRGFGHALLADTVGWPAALAVTLGELEHADLRPSDLVLDDDAVLGVRDVWEAAEASAGPSWTRARILVEAAQRLESDTNLIRRDDLVLAVMLPTCSAVTARFIRAIPTSSTAILAMRPSQPAAVPVAETRPACRGRTDLAIAAAHMFTDDVAGGSPARPYAAELPDGTLVLEEHDGVASEIDATVDWVVRRVLEGFAPDRIAVLAPIPDPWCGLVASGLRSAGIVDSPLPVRVADGVPLVHDAAGRRIFAVITALREHLAADALVDVLASVRAPSGTGQRPSRARVVDLVYALGTRGGSTANPDRAVAWRERIAHAERRFAAPIDADGFADQAEHVAKRHETRLSTLAAVRDATLALCDLADAVAREARLDELRSMLVAFAQTHLLAPGDAPRLLAIFEQRTDSVAQDAACRTIRGRAAVDVLATLLERIRIGADADDVGVHVGTIAGAAGLTFDAVRIIGLAEGSIPPTVRGDPVLSDDLRMRISPRLATGASRVAEALGELDLVIRGARQRLAISAPRLAMDRTVREPSSVFIEIGAALARPQSGPWRTPTLDDLRRTEVVPAREVVERERLARPCRPADWLDRLAAGCRELPRWWRSHSSLDLLRVRGDTPSPDAWSRMDGILDAERTAVPDTVIPGLTPARPISSWMLRTLVECPHRFLFQHGLGWYAPLVPPPGHDLDPKTFGDLLHAVAERFFRLHGPAFLGHERTLVEWRELVRDIAAQELARLLESHGLDSEDAASAVRRRLLVHVDRLLEGRWAVGPRRFVAAEWAFGFGAPLELATRGGRLFLRGRIDLIDADDTEAAIHDLKTGKCTPRRGRDSDASPTTDLQIGLYALIVVCLAEQLGIPARAGGSYVHTNEQRGAERAFFGDDGDTLREAALDWLECARELLSARTFPRTPHHTDCTFCGFQPVCGDRARRRADTLLATASEPALVHFRKLKGAR